MEFSHLEEIHSLNLKLTAKGAEKWWQRETKILSFGLGLFSVAKSSFEGKAQLFRTKPGNPPFLS